MQFARGIVYRDYIGSGKRMKNLLKVQHVFALTFDDGPGPSTEDLLDVLEVHKIRATFFLLGKNVVHPRWCSAQRVEQILLRSLKAGHQLGNHTMTHPATPRSKRGFIKEVLDCDKLIAGLHRRAGLPPKPIPFRLPYGPRWWDGKQDLRLNHLAALGKTSMHWTYLVPDWVNPTKPISEELFEKMRAHCVSQLRLGVPSVFCAHDGASELRMSHSRKNTVDAISLFLDYAKERNWKSSLSSSLADG